MNSDLEALERDLGAEFGRYADVELPARFSDLQREWSAIRQRCGLLDARFRGLLRITGSDRTTFLQGMITNDVVKLQSGQGTYAALLNIQGKVVSDLRVYVLAEELWLDLPAARASAVRQMFERHIIADDVEFVENERTALVVLEGPQAASLAMGVFGESVEDLLPLAHREMRLDGDCVRLAAVTHAGESGFVVFGDPATAARLWQRCQAAGAEPVGMEALDVLRLEAGIPWYGHDMDESMLISEAGLEAAISYHKGCYLGQEVVERIAARGQVHRKLVGLVCEGQIVPPPNSKLVCDGKEAGWITSAAWSPARASIIALGYLQREYWDAGREMSVTLPQGSTPARVAPLPFYVRSSQ
ncbi:MAG: aminomethyltransferase family protein [Candidatus Binatia bacterium]